MSRPVIVLFTGYVASILFTLWDAVGGLILPRLPWWIVLPAFFGGPGFGLLILLWALFSPRSWTRWRIAIPALAVGILVLWFVPGPLFRYGISRFVQRPDLNAYAARVHAYRQITGLDEENGDIRSLNGTLVARTRAGVDSLRAMSWYGKDAMLLADVLARESVDPAVSEDLLGGLRRFGFQRLSRHADYVLFARTRDSGLVYAAAGAPPLKEGATVPGTGVLISGRMGRWYRYVCCAQEPTIGPPDTVARDTGPRDVRPK